MDYETLNRAAAAVEGRWPKANPRVGVILGSGWSELVDTFEVRDSMPYEEIPGLGKPGVAGHSGRLAWAVSAGVETLIFQGRRHYYEGEGWTPIAAPPFIFKRMGVSRAVLTNAAGGLREDLVPGTLMAIEDHINNMGANPLLGKHHPFWGARFPDQSHVYDPQLRELAFRAAAAAGEDLKRGVYMANSGPVYETPAEIRAFRALGVDAVGMSTVPEAVLLSAAGLKTLAISCISNLAAGIAKHALSHEEVTTTTKDVMPRMQALFVKLWEEFAKA